MDGTGLRVLSGIGLVAMLALAWVFSENRRKVDWRLVVIAMGLQLAFGMLVLWTAAGRGFFQWVKTGFDAITTASNQGASFLFGNLTQPITIAEAAVPGQEPGPLMLNAVVAFQVLPVIIFVSGIAAILQHWGIIQAVVRGMAWLMRRTLRTSGAETFAAALLVFLGIESASALGGYLKSMTRSEIFTIMTTFLATIAASVMVAYASFGAEPGHLLAASIMSAPAALAMAKILVPEIGEPETAGGARIELARDSHNVFDAASLGAMRGLQMALNVGALLIVFVGLIHLLDLLAGAITGNTLTGLVAWVFYPFAFLMGVPQGDIGAVAELLATKSVFNEFLAYSQLQPLIAEDAISPRAKTIATYALCGFANPGSIGIMIGAMAPLMPERRAELAQLSLRAFLGGTLAAFTTACVAGLLT